MLESPKASPVHLSGNHKVKRSPGMICRRCGTCCRHWQAPVTPREMEKLAEGLGISHEALKYSYLEPYPMRENSYLIRHANRACVFLKYQGRLARCLVHPFRPDACRNWEPAQDKKECRDGLTEITSPDLVLPQYAYRILTDGDAFTEDFSNNKATIKNWRNHE